MTSVIHPLWVHENHFIDKTDPQAKNDPKNTIIKIFLKTLFTQFLSIYLLL